jgi:hypothetical protein
METTDGPQQEIIGKLYGDGLPSCHRPHHWTLVVLIPVPTSFQVCCPCASLHNVGTLHVFIHPGKLWDSRTDFS